MTIRKAIAILTVAVYAMAAYAAAPQFATKRLERISAAVGVAPQGMRAGANDETSHSYRGRPLRVRTNAFGDVSHVGYRLFANRTVSAYGDTRLFDFIERYCLELDLKLDARQPAERMDIDKVVCTEGNIAMLRSVTPDSPVSVEEISRRMYRVKFTVGAQKLSLTIPADYQLISGADAIELENIFERNIKRTVPVGADAAIGRWDGVQVSRAEGTLIANAGQYLSEMIRSDIYLTESNGRRRLMLDPSRPRHTVCNILLTGQYSRDIPLQLTIDRYGYTSTTVKVTVGQFVAACLMEGCRMYVGIKTHSGSSYTATLFALNEKMAYNHVLSVDFPTAILTGSEQEVRGTLYAYIPLQNVTERFFTQDLKNDYR